MKLNKKLAAVLVLAPSFLLACSGNKGNNEPEFHDYSEIHFVYDPSGSNEKITFAFSLPTDIDPKIDTTIEVDWDDGNGKVNAAAIYNSQDETYTVTSPALTKDSTIKIHSQLDNGFGLDSANNFNKYQIDQVTFGNNIKSLTTKPKGWAGVLQDCASLKTVNISNTVTSIGDYAFSACYSLSNIYIGKSVNALGKNAFCNCYSLKDIVFHSSFSTSTIGEYTFQNCYNLKSIVIPEGVTKISYCAFQNCYGLESATLPSTLTEIEYQAFENCYNLKSIVIPEGVTTMGNKVFNQCYGLESATLPSTLSIVREETFYYCYNLKSIVIPENVTKIENKAFYYCYALESATLPSTLEEIGMSVFYYCSNLKSIVIPDGVTKIDGSSFDYCLNIESIVIPDSVTTMISNFANWTVRQSIKFVGCADIDDITAKYGSNPINSNCRAIILDGTL